MPEKAPQFTVTDRRKFTLEGELREGVAETEHTAQHSPEPVAATPAASPEPAATQTEPAPAAATEELPAIAPEAGQEADDLGPSPSAQETADQHAAYRESSQQLDDMLRKSNPGLEAPGEVNFEAVVQSIYLSAVVAMGADTQPGEKPRIDIIGARQSIDMLSVLQDKTKGNLNDREQRLLSNALFDLRMMFLQITNAIAAQAQRPPSGPPPRK